jgi:hypothetical protein
MRKGVRAVLGEIVGFLTKLAVWAFLIGLAVGIYLTVRYWPEPDAVRCVAASGLVAPLGAAGPSG